MGIENQKRFIDHSKKGMYPPLSQEELDALVAKAKADGKLKKLETEDVSDEQKRSTKGVGKGNKDDYLSSGYTNTGH